MPQNVISPSKADGFPSEEDMEGVADRLNQAIKRGLQTEWLTWYTAGIAQGLSPRQSAWEASYEWDLWDFA